MIGWIATEHGIVLTMSTSFLLQESAQTRGLGHGSGTSTCIMCTSSSGSNRAKAARFSRYRGRMFLQPPRYFADNKQDIFRMLPAGSPHKTPCAQHPENVLLVVSKIPWRL